MPLTARPRPDSPLHELEFAVVDVETTGSARDGRDRMTEFGAVLVRDGAIAGEYRTLVNPLRPIPRAVVRLTGITNEMVADAPVFSDVADDVHDVLDGRVFEAHNVRFDWAVVTGELADAGAHYSAERLCTVHLARRLVPHLTRRNLDALSAYYGVHNSARHRAHGDARATAEIFVRMLDELGRRGVHTWAELRSLLRGARGRRKRSALPRAVTDFRIA